MRGNSLLSRLTDEDVVALCRRDDAAGWDELVARFSRYVYAIATQAYRLREHDAEEVFQEVFARAYTHLSTLRDDSAIRPWIGQLTRRLAVDRLRGAARRETPLEGMEEPVDVDERLERIETALDVHRAMDTLPEGCREVLDRFFARDESYATISAALGLPQGTIASRISRCLAKLRVELEGKIEPRSPVLSMDDRSRT